jgi:hypothetical protein
VFDSARKGFGLLSIACLVAGFVVRQLQQVLDGPTRRQQERRRRHLLRGRGLGCPTSARGLGASLGQEAVRAGAVDGAEPDADACGQEPLVVAGESAGDVDGLIAVVAEQRPVLHAEDEGRPLLTDVAARERCRGVAAVEREPLVLAGQLVGGVDLDVAARAQRRLVRAAHHGGRRGAARVALDPHLWLHQLSSAQPGELSYPRDGWDLGDYRTAANGELGGGRV